MEPTVIGLISAGALAVLVLGVVFVRYKFPEKFSQTTNRKMSYQNTNPRQKTFMVNSKHI